MTSYPVASESAPVLSIMTGDPVFTRTTILFGFLEFWSFGCSLSWFPEIHHAKQILNGAYKEFS